MEKSGFLHRLLGASVLKYVKGPEVFDVQLEPDEQEISIPKLIERIVSPPGRRIKKSTTTLREVVYDLLDDEKNAAARKKYQDEVEKRILGDIAKKRLTVTRCGARSVILVRSLVEWTFSYDKNVTQKGDDGRESYAAVAKAEMLKQSKNTKPPPVPPRLRQREQEAEILAWLRENSHDPKKLPVRENGHGTPKALARTALDGIGLFEGATTFEKAWGRLRTGKEIKEVE